MYLTAAAPLQTQAETTAQLHEKKFLPGFAANEQAKAAYGMTFGQIGSMLGLPDAALQGLLSALDTL
mgnify:FL=1